MTPEFKVGDLVWAKMKGYSPWPGRVSESSLGPLRKQTKKSGVQCIFFFGTKNFAWIDDANIKPYQVYRDTFFNSNKSFAFKEATAGIESFIQKLAESPDYTFEKYLKQNDFDNLLDNADSLKKRKDITVKRPAKSLTSTSAKKKPRLSEANGDASASPSFSTYNSSPIKNYDEILNRPTVVAVPELPMIDLNNVSEAMRNKNIEPSSKSFGFLGLGIMGSGIVKNLINSGHKVNIWSRSIRKAEDVKAQADISHPGQVEAYNVPCDVVANSDIIFCCVSDPGAVNDIIHDNCGVLHNIVSLDGKGYVEMTNIDPKSSLDINNIITSKGGRYVEAQLQGSKLEASEGNLIVLGAGDKSLFDDCYTAFTAIGKTVFFLGNIGFASKMNLVIQLMKGVCLVGVAEGLALADRAGLSPNDVLEIFSLTTLASPFLKSKAELIINNDFQNVSHPLEHMQKDLKLSLQLADTMKQPLLMGSTANEVYKHARRLGYDSHDASAVYMRTRH